MGVSFDPGIAQIGDAQIGRLYGLLILISFQLDCCGDWITPKRVNACQVNRNKDNKIGGIWVGEREILLDWDLIIPINGGVRAIFAKPVEFDQFGKKKQRSAIPFLSFKLIYCFRYFRKRKMCPNASFLKMLQQATSPFYCFRFRFGRFFLMGYNSGIPPNFPIL